MPAAMAVPVLRVRAVRIGTIPARRCMQKNFTGRESGIAGTGHAA